MKISKSDFIKWSDELTRSKHKWEVVMPFGSKGELRFRTCKFEPGEYEKAEDQYEAVCDLIRGCRFSDTEYYVFCDDKLVIGF